MFREGRESLPKVFISDSLELKQSEIHRWGIFAKNSIPKDTLIESAPILIFHESTLTHLFELNETRHVLQDYPFIWKDGCVCIAFGWGSMYNHSNENNAHWRPNYEYETIEFRTKKDIKPGEEITVKYLPAQLRGNLWFDDGGNASIHDVGAEINSKPDWKLL